MNIFPDRFLEEWRCSSIKLFAIKSLVWWAFSLFPQSETPQICALLTSMTKGIICLTQRRENNAPRSSFAGITDYRPVIIFTNRSVFRSRSHHQLYGPLKKCHFQKDLSCKLALPVQKFSSSFWNSSSFEDWTSFLVWHDYRVMISRFSVPTAISAPFWGRNGTRLTDL